MEKYTIWMEPEGEIKERLSAVIRQLSQRYGTPTFNPHVTLLGGLEGEESDLLIKIAELTNSVKPLDISLTGRVCCEEVWSRAMIVLAEKHPPLMQANEAARRIFNIQTTPFIPHASLMYTRTVPISSEERLMAAGQLDQLTGRFAVRSLNLYREHAGVERWDKIKEFPLGSS